MTVLRQALTDYLTLRRTLGHKLDRAEKLLWQYLDFLEANELESVSVQNALEWATSPARSRAWSALRLSAVRGFAGYLHTIDETCEVPPRDLLTPRPRARVPYLYTDEQLSRLLAATNTISSPWRAATYRTLLGLLAVSGIRVGEAIKADQSDLDRDTGVLLVRHGKFGKRRLLPLHPSTVHALGRYLDRPDRPRPASAALLLSTVGTRLHYPDVLRTFHSLLKIAGIEPRSQRCTPRIHDLRHTYAVQTLLNCYRTGADVDARLPVLSTYMGHVNPANTYWYLTGSAELLALAGQRLQTSLGENS